MEGESGEFHDWEVLQSSDDAGLDNPSGPISSPRDLEGIESESEGIIRSDYFSLESKGKYARTAPEGDASEDGSVVSDNPSWIDPGSEARYPRTEPGEFWSDSSSDRSDDRKLNDFDVEKEMGFLAKGRGQLGSEGSGEIATESDGSDKFWSDSGGIGTREMKSEEFEKENEMGVGDLVDSKEGSVSEVLGEGKNEEIAIEAMKSSGEEEKRTAVAWWKLPMEFVKYCVLRASPVWTLSVAAAVMGFVILGRRLYKMKRKSRTLQLKVTVDDKKVSQFTSRAARLNEAFSVVKRVPVIIRPSLPVPGVTPWPVMSLR